MPLSSIPTCGGWTPGPIKRIEIEILLRYGITNEVAKFLPATCPQEGVRCPDLGVTLCYYLVIFRLFYFYFILCFILFDCILFNFSVSTVLEHKFCRFYMTVTQWGLY